MMSVPADDECARETASSNRDNTHAGINRRSCGCRAIRGCVGRLEERRVRGCLSIVGPDRGDPQFYLGFMNEYGQGVSRNDAEAIRWYRKAADQDHALAQFRLGDLYSNGEGSPRDEIEAAKWYRLAADQGLGAAQFRLGMIYAEGKGVPQDRVLAHMWLNLVVSELPPLGKQQRNATVDALNLVVSQMTLSQVAEAQQLAFQWLTEHHHLLQQKNLVASFR
jgi:TPR repeat protein